MLKRIFLSNHDIEHTKDRAKVVLSSRGKCSSNAKTMQLAMMVNKTMYSKGLEQRQKKEQGQKKMNDNQCEVSSDFHSITAFARFRIQFFFEKINNERSFDALIC